MWESQDSFSSTSLFCVSLVTVVTKYSAPFYGNSGFVCHFKTVIRRNYRISNTFSRQCSVYGCKKVSRISHSHNHLFNQILLWKLWMCNKTAYLLSFQYLKNTIPTRSDAPRNRYIPVYNMSMVHF